MKIKKHIFKKKQFIIYSKNNKSKIRSKKSDKNNCVLSKINLVPVHKKDITYTKK